jgi:hypothetical protein
MRQVLFNQACRYRVLSAVRHNPKQIERNGIGHGLHPQIVGMHAVAAVKGRQDARRMARVTQRTVEVDHRVEFLAVADPVVHSLAHQLFARRVKAGVGGSFERRDGAAGSGVPGETGWAHALKAKLAAAITQARRACFLTVENVDFMIKLLGKISPARRRTAKPAEIQLISSIACVQLSIPIQRNRSG